MVIDWKAILAALKVLEKKVLRPCYRRRHEKAVDEINRNRLVQVRNPRSGQWKIIDRDKGEIIGTADKAEEGIEVAE
jgi:hypothetical protein